MKATFVIPKQIIIGTFLLILLYAVAIRSCVAQTLGATVGFSGNGIVHTGITTQNTFGKVGFYAIITTDETDGNSKCFNSFNKNLTHLSGLTAGVNFDLSPVMPHSYISLGMGRIKESSYALSKCLAKKTFVCETIINIQITRFLDVFCGVNSYPLILSGFNLKLYKK